MSGATYQLIVIVVGSFALYRGYKRGLTGQISGILGFAFAIVFTYLFSKDVAALLEASGPSFISFPLPSFIYSVMASAIIYTVVYWVVKLLTNIFRKMLKIMNVGLLDRIFGSFFSLLKYMVGLSLIFNLLLCINPNSALLKYSQHDDGNLISGVLSIAPAILGCVSPDDLSHAIQLIEAKKIS